MYEVSHSDKKSPDGTGYNDPPENIRELTEKEFAQSQFHSHSPSFIEYRQMILKEDLSPGKLSNGRMMAAFLYWFSDDTGVAISSDHYKGKIRYFAFGCNHDLGQVTYRAGSIYECKRCKAQVKEPWMQKITEDSGWSLNGMTSRPSRGIRDYDRTIKFSSALEPNELLKVVKFLRKVNCPGWTGVGCKDQGSGSYKFSTTYDSSD